MSGLSAERITAYLDRIGAEGPVGPDAETLQRLHRAHLRTVPFENLSIHLGEEISLEPEAQFEKIVTRRRGGYCYELNGLFALLLEQIGFRVERLSARAYWEARGAFGPPLDHLTLRVTDAAGEVWLADVGFGRHSELPLRYQARTDQADPFGTLRVADVEGGELDVLMDGVPAYRVDPRTLALADFAPGNWWQQTSPQSHFKRSVLCSLPTDAGRVTLSGRKLITTDTGEKRELELEDDATVLAAYREHFGIELTVVPELKA
jgi:N-hydroxyarylamine O-acetyltransferase